MQSCLARWPGGARYCTSGNIDSRIFSYAAAALSRNFARCGQITETAFDLHSHPRVGWSRARLRVSNSLHGLCADARCSTPPMTSRASSTRTSTGLHRRLEEEDGRDAHDQPVARRLEQAGAGGGERSRGRRRHLQPVDRHRLPGQDRRPRRRQLAREVSQQRLALHHDLVFLVRKGNPKGIKDWDDLAKPGVKVIVPNPKTSGNGRYTYLAAWGYALKKTGSEDGAREFVDKLFANVPVLDGGGRGATTTFTQRDIGDVLVTFENEAYLASLRNSAPTSSRSCTLDLSILAEPPVAWSSKVVDKRGTRKRRAGLSRTSSTRRQARRIIAKHCFRPRDARRAARRTRRSSRRSRPSRRGAVRRLGQGAEASTSPTAASSTRSSRPWRRRNERPGPAGPVSGAAASLPRASGRAPAGLRPHHGRTCRSIVLMPLAALVVKIVEAGTGGFWRVCPTRACWRPSLSFGVSLLAAAINAVFGLLVAWVLTRYSFPGRRLLDAVGRPAVRPAHGGRRHRADAALRAQRLDRPILAPLGIKVAYTPLGVFDRADLHRPALRRAHGAAGARGPRRARSRRPPRRSAPRRWQTFARVVLPALAARAADRLRAGLRARASANTAR